MLDQNELEQQHQKVLLQPAQTCLQHGRSWSEAGKQFSTTLRLWPWISSDQQELAS